MASADEDRTVLVWDVLIGEGRIRLVGHSSYIGAIVFTPDMNFIVSGTGDKLIKLWNASSGKLEATLKGHIGTVRSLVIRIDLVLGFLGSFHSSMESTF